jgi:tRNA_anti-like
MSFAKLTPVMCLLPLLAVGQSTRPGSSSVPVLNEQGMELVMYGLVDDMEASVRGGDTLLKPEETLRLTGIDLETTAEQYDADYDANEVAADQKYKGKKILLTGVIESINEDFKGGAYLVLKASNPFMGVHAELNSRGKAGASAMAKGTTIYLVCDSGTRIMGSATARNCQQFSQYLDQIRPSLKSTVEKYLQEELSAPAKLMQGLRVMYVVGTELPADSPCFTGMDDACKASLAAIEEDKAKTQAMAEQIKRTFPAGASSNSPPEDVAQLMAQEDALNNKCRGGSGGNEATLESCNERDVILGKIQANNWCWGHDGQIGADRTWEPCHHDNSVKQENPGTQATPQGQTTATAVSQQPEPSPPKQDIRKIEQANGLFTVFDANRVERYSNGQVDVMIWPDVPQHSGWLDTTTSVILMFSCQGTFSTMDGDDISAQMNVPPNSVAGKIEEIVCRKPGP